MNRPKQAAGGFTLVELLVVIVIIGILAATSMAAMSAARQKARVGKTRSTIVKIDRVVQKLYASYRTRRVPLDRRQIGNIAQAKGWWAGSPAPIKLDAIARVRLLALRDIMRMEMPEHVTDIGNPPLQVLSAEGMQPPALSTAYNRKLDRAKTKLGNVGMTPAEADTIVGRYSSAECLYMIVTMSSPDSRETFMPNEIGDADADGLPEFLDAWGNPIRFFRWAPAFNDSDIQPNILSPDDLAMSFAMADPCAILSDPAVMQKMQDASLEDHDPFDSHNADFQLDAQGNPDPQGVPRGWRLVPLIYSAGPDGIYDIGFDTVTGTTAYAPFTGNPYVNEDSSGNFTPRTAGLPRDLTNTSVTAAEASENGSLDHYDNIHNHRIEATQ